MTLIKDLCKNIPGTYIKGANGDELRVGKTVVCGVTYGKFKRR